MLAWLADHEVPTPAFACLSSDSPPESVPGAIAAAVVKDVDAHLWAVQPDAGAGHTGSVLLNIWGMLPASLKTYVVEQRQHYGDRWLKEDRCRVRLRLPCRSDDMPFLMVACVQDTLATV